jgi:excisionase family DNA binding protein
MRTSFHEILDVAGAAVALGVSERLVLRLLRSGKLPGKKVGREWRLSRSAILLWLKTPEASAERGPKWLENALQSGRAEVGGERSGGERS